VAQQTELVVILDDRPGTAAQLGAVLGEAGINIEGVCGVVSGNEGVLHVLVESDAQRAHALLEAAGMRVDHEREVFVTSLPDRPGEMARILHRLAAADVNCDLLYLTARGRLVIGAEDITQVSSILT
jgi:hypothetical protein